MGGWNLLVRGTKYVITHPVQLLKGGVIAPLAVGGTAMAARASWGVVFNDKTLVQAASEEVVGDKGLVGAAGDVLVGDKNNIVDAAGERILGKDRVEKISDTAEAVADTTKKVVGAAGNVAEGAGEAVTNLVSGRSSSDGSPSPQQAMPQQAMSQQQLYEAYQQQAMQQPQNGGLFSMLNPFNAISNVIGGVANGGSGMSLAALIPAAFLMFGNFGWMGKIASLFLGSLAMKNIRQQQSQSYNPYPQVVQTPQQNYEQLALASRQNDDNVVHRGRGV